ncbi:hypothetical protein BZA77DRAFT_356826 [Pyronema omphalodes]|nr:hypothetical protein BZA77DRAFT_356826 [Pyronema omphalodes]
MAPGNQSFIFATNPQMFLQQGMGQVMNTLPMGSWPAVSDVPRYTAQGTTSESQAPGFFNVDIGTPQLPVAGASTIQSSAGIQTFRPTNINTPPLHTNMAGTGISRPTAQKQTSRPGTINTPPPVMEMARNNMGLPVAKR